jgi:hypothetical protein
MPYNEVANLVTVTKTNRRHALCLWNSKNYCVENTAPSLPPSCSRSLSQTWAEVWPSPQFDYPNSQILYRPECTFITAGAFRSTWECSCRVWEHFAKIQGGLGESGSTWKHWWGLLECLGDLRAASGLIYILLMQYLITFTRECKCISVKL